MVPEKLPVKCVVSGKQLESGSAVLLAEYKVKTKENDQTGNIYLVAVSAKIKRMAFTNAVILKSVDDKTTYSADSDHWVDDDTDGSPDEDKSAKHPPDKVKSYPCSYKRNVDVNIKAKFKLTNPKIKKIWIRGKSGSADSPLVFDKKEVDVSGGDAVYERTSTEGKLVDTVRGYITANRGKPWGINDPLTLKWEFSLDGEDDSWSDAGGSQHTVYVTLDAPNEDLKNRQETIFNLSCRTGDKEDTHEAVFSKVWQEIKGLEVKRMDNQIMRYWNPMQLTAGSSMKAMLAHKFGNGTCGSWAELLLKTLKAHNDPNVKGVLIIPMKTAFPATVGFLTKEWEFTKSISSGVNNKADSKALKEDDDIQTIDEGDETFVQVRRQAGTPPVYVDEDGNPIDPTTGLGPTGKPNAIDLVKAEVSFIFPGINLKIDTALKPDDRLVEGDTGNTDWLYSTQTFTFDGSNAPGIDLGTAGPKSIVQKLRVTRRMMKKETKDAPQMLLVTIA